jgi:alkaline phosphatase D
MIKLFAEENLLSITNGVASGDVTKNSSIIWSKSNMDSTMNIKYYNTSDFSFNHKLLTVKVNESSDYTGHIKLNNLLSDTEYYYQVWFSDPQNSSIVSNTIIGKFKTAPDDSAENNIHFIMAGDLGGSTLCRQRGIGYPIFFIMNTISPDFFIFNGDQIYADNVCPSIPFSVYPLKIYPYWKNIKGEFTSIRDRSIDWENVTALHETYLKHWEYNRADPNLQNFLSNTSFYSQSDDHEIINDYGGKWKNYSISDIESERNRTGYPNLIKLGMDVFFKFSPIDRNEIEKDRVYRSFNWGKNLDLYLLDAHSYRSLNNLPDTTENNKTLYGKERLNWLKDNLLPSKSIWKVISTPVPITVPNCFYGPTKLGGCDNWATNNKTNETFVKERNQFLKFLDENDIKNVVFIATDIHFAGTVKVIQDFDGDGDTYTFHELINGPLTTSTRDTTNPVDPTINAKYLYNESAIFNFGNFKIEKDENDNKNHFLYNVIDANGRIRPYSDLNIVPE